jgi:AcrR family transcriptional regulator
MNHKSATTKRLAGATRMPGKRYRTGEARRAAILDAAHRVLVTHGYAQVTVQRVAAAVGISAGNLNYYFPTRAALLRGLITRTLDAYRERTRVLAAGAPAARGTAGLPAVLRWLVRDAAKPETSRLFRQLWAVAAIDPEVAAAMDEFYAETVRGHLRQLGLARKGRAGSADVALLTLLLTISEGTTVLFGTRPEASRLLRQVEALALRALDGLDLSAAGPAGKSAR